jgi:hypothetical protein
MKKDFKRITRKFLNKKEGLAAIQTDFQSGSWSMGGDIIISDCNRNINLDFHVFDSKNFADKLEKIDILIKELSAYRILMEEHFPEFNKRKLEKSKERKLTSKTVTLEELLNDK